MGNIISSSISSTFSYVAGEARYIWNLENNLDALQSEFNRLIRIRDDLENSVTSAEQQRMRRTNRVIGWLESVKQMETRFAELQRNISQELGRLCLYGFCSTDLISSYRFGRNVTRLKQDVIDLKNEREEIRVIAEMVPEDPAIEIPVDRTIVGQQSIFELVWRCLGEQQVGIIGLYGTGGVGKTTLLKQINNKFCKEHHNFDVVIWVRIVSKEPKIEQIQDDIGRRMGLSDQPWRSKRVGEKSLDICHILRQKQFVLLLDDLWHPIDLKEVGIPLQCLNNTGSKIVFTTRSLDVCGQMGADKKFKVRCLTRDEAWRLFEEKVGKDTLENHDVIRKEARRVFGECGGLPLALITIGQTMNSETSLPKWRKAVQDLKTSASEFSKMEEKVYSCLKFSYDHLPNGIAKSCLLYCSLFPKDYRIPKEELIDYWFGEGFLDDLNDGDTIISDLLRACLLEEEFDDHVKMHDMIRDMALWIACKIEKEEENFLVCAGARLKEAPKIKDGGGIRRISLMKNQIKMLSATPHCPRLQTLLVNGNDLEFITDNFFQSMPSLRVLSLRGNSSLTWIPSGLSSLVSLEHLDLSNTSIRELPQDLEALVNLRYLNLEYLYMIHSPRQLLCSFTKLQVLKMLEYAKAEEDVEHLMKELSCLENLNVLTFALYDAHALEIFVTFKELLSCTQSLSLRNFYRPMAVDISPLAYMKHLKKLYIRYCAIEDLKIDFAGRVEEVLQSGFPNLDTLYIEYCSGLKDVTWLVCAPNLKNINIRYCDNMEEIITVQKLSEVSGIMEKFNLFAELEFLCLVDLGNLESIYRSPLPVTQLKEIKVTGCPKLKKLPLDSNSAKERKIVIKGQSNWWQNLQWEDEATESVFSTCFKID